MHFHVSLFFFFFTFEASYGPSQCVTKFCTVSGCDKYSLHFHLSSPQWKLAHPSPGQTLHELFIIRAVFTKVLMPMYHLDYNLLTIFSLSWFTLYISLYIYLYPICISLCLYYLSIKRYITKRNRKPSITYNNYLALFEFLWGTR